MTTIKKPEWFFYPGWVVLTALSIPVAFAITWIIVSQVEQVIGGRVMINGRSRITEDWLAGYVFVPALGLVTGLLQYWLLCRYLPGMGWWVGATALGWPLAAAIVSFLNIFLPENLDTNANWFVFLMIILVSGLIGFMQWLVLRRCVPHAIWWIPATIAGWMTVRLAAGPALTGPLDIWYLGVLPAILTAVTLALLINHAQPPEPQGYTG